MMHSHSGCCRVERTLRSRNAARASEKGEVLLGQGNHNSNNTHSSSSSSSSNDTNNNTNNDTSNNSSNNSSNNVLLRGVGTLRDSFPPNASVQRQPGDLTIHTKKRFLRAGFLGAPPISLRASEPHKVLLDEAAKVLFCWQPLRFNAINIIIIIIITITIIIIIITCVYIYIYIY